MTTTLTRSTVVIADLGDDFDTAHSIVSDAIMADPTLYGLYQMGAHTEAEAVCRGHIEFILDWSDSAQEVREALSDLVNAAYDVGVNIIR